MSANSASLPSAAASLIGWVLLCFAAAAGGIVSPPDAWYAALAKPSWNPPGWLFGPVWSVLYLMMGIAAWRIWRLPRPTPGRGGALMFFLVQLALNAAWTPVFFGVHAPGAAFGVIVLLWVAILVTLSAFLRLDRTAGRLLVPYLLWVTFAAVLNFTLWRMNPGA